VGGERKISLLGRIILFAPPSNDSASSDQLRSKLRQPFVFSSSESVLHDHVPPFDVPQFAESLNKASAIFVRTVSARQITNLPHPAGRLRFGNARSGERAHYYPQAEKRNELTPPHVRPPARKWQLTGLMKRPGRSKATAHVISDETAEVHCGLGVDLNQRTPDVRSCHNNGHS
jgi:hypothetical protein